MVGSANDATTTLATSPEWIGWNRLPPFPGTGIRPGDSRTRSAMMLKKPSPWPNWSDGLRIVHSSPDAATSASAFAFELA